MKQTLCLIAGVVKRLGEAVVVAKKVPFVAMNQLRHSNKNWASRPYLNFAPLVNGRLRFVLYAVAS